jgi:long-chain acyl-CoA synthetase
VIVEQDLPESVRAVFGDTSRLRGKFLKSHREGAKTQRTIGLPDAPAESVVSFSIMTVTEVRESPPGAVSEKTFCDFFEEVARRFPERTAFRLKTGKSYRQMTYRELFDQAKAVGLGLSEAGIRPGERVAILSENRPEWVVSYLGILMAGATVVPLDSQISPAEWRRLLDDSESRMVFVSGLLAGKLHGAIDDSDLKARWICFDPIPETRGSRREFSAFLRSAESSEPRPALPGAAPDDVAVIIYTSGTTGRPKGVMLTHANLVAEIVSVLEIIPVDENDTLLCLLPLQHVFASVVNVLIPLYVGARVTFVDTLKRSEILEALEAAGITILATVPQFFYLFHDRIREELGKKPAIVRAIFRWMLAVNHFCLTRLRLNLGKILFGKIHRTFGSKLRLFVSGGSSFDPKVAQEFYDFGFTILQGYGLTETTGAATATTVEDNELGSVGKPLPGVEVRVMDPDSAGVGEIAIRGPIVMKGYYRNAEATDQVLRDGWFHSGDLGRLDDGGNLFITGREKEVIVLPNGKNIYPDELETHYQQCPYIQEIAVIGVHEEGSRAGAERLHAVVVPNFEYLKSKKIANAREILRD